MTWLDRTCTACSATATMPPPPASFQDVEVHPAGRWRGSSIVLHLYTKFEVRRPARSGDMSDFGHGVNRPGDLDLWPFDL